MSARDNPFARPPDGAASAEPCRRYRNALLEDYFMPLEFAFATVRPNRSFNHEFNDAIAWTGVDAANPMGKPSTSNRSC